MSNQALSTVIEALRTMNATELREVNRMACEHLKIRMAEGVRDFRPGQRVQFVGRTGLLVVGTVRKINQKTLTVLSDQTPPVEWKVPPTILSPAPEGATSAPDPRHARWALPTRQPLIGIPSVP